MLSNEPYMSAENIGLAIGISRRAVMKHIKILQNEGILRRIGPDKGGYWEVMNKNL
jgi:ATP-dependent DNA helicase RecG